MFKLFSSQNSDNTTANELLEQLEKQKKVLQVEIENLHKNKIKLNFTEEEFKVCKDILTSRLNLVINEIERFEMITAYKY